MSRPLILALLALALLAPLTPAAAQATPPTLVVDHLGPNEVPGPWLLAVTVQHATWIRVSCAGSDTPVRSLRNPFPGTPTRWEFVSTTPLCPGEVVVALDAVNAPPVSFGPYGPTGGAYARGDTPARSAASTVFLPLLAR